MSLNQRQWDILCQLQSADKPMTTGMLANLVAPKNKGTGANSKSFRQMIARDLRDIKRITGAIKSENILSEDDEGNGYRENVYSWNTNSPPLMANALTTAQSVALSVLQKVGIGLVPKSVLDELNPLFTAIHKNELIKKQSGDDFGKRVAQKTALAKEEKWLSKIAILSETVGFDPAEISPEIEKQVYEALYKEEIIEIHYRNNEFIVKPLALVQRGVRRYLIGIKRGHGTTPAYLLLSRIQKVKPVHVLDYKDIKGGEAFDLDAFLRKGLAYPAFDDDVRGEPINLKLWVDEGTYGWLSETPLDKSQTAKKVKDGYELTLTTTLREELAFWILSMANHVRVISPKVLKDRIVSDLNAAASQYCK